MTQRDFRRTKFRLLAALLLAFAPGVQAACHLDIAASESVKAERERSDYVLTAFVTAARVVPDPDDAESFAGIVYTVKPLDIVKGEPVGALTVYSENSSGRFPMNVGGTYVLFAKQRANGDLSVDGCGNSGEVTGRFRVLQSLGLSAATRANKEPPGRNWADAWEIVLAARPNSLATCDLHVMFRDQGDVPLEAANLVYSLTHDGEMYGWAIDEKLQSERIRLEPGETLTRTSRLGDLQFSDLKGKEVDLQQMTANFRTGTWSIIASMNDLGLAKPEWLASNLVRSNHVALDGGRVAKCMDAR